MSKEELNCSAIISLSAFTKSQKKSLSWVSMLIPAEDNLLEGFDIKKFGSALFYRFLKDATQEEGKETFLVLCQEKII